jgi:hypothetical protein
MGTPISYLSGGTRGYESGIFKNSTTGLGFTFPLTTDYRWWNGVDVTSTQYLLYSDLNSVGQATVANSRPTAWTTPDLTDQSLLNLINTLPERVGLPAFTTIGSGFQWLQSTGTYFLIKLGYENVVTSNLQLNYDAGWYASYNGTGTSVTDLSGNNRTGTLTNGVSFNSSGVGSFVFDGADDYITSSLATNANNNVTLEVWFNSDNVNRDGQMILYNGSDSSGNGYGISINQESVTTGNVYALYGAVSWFNTGYKLESNQWYHGVLTISDTTLRIYINGLLIYTATSSNPNTPTLYTNIGRNDFPSSRYFDGKIPIARVYTSALTPNQVLQNYNAQKSRFGITSMVQDSLLSLDAGNYASYPQTGTNWFNLSSSNYNADLINGVSWSSTSGGTFNFDGTDDYATITSLNNFNFGSSITVGAWLLNIGGDYRGVISNVYSTGTGFDMRFGRENWSGGTNNGTALNLAVKTSNGDFAHTVDGTLNSWGYYAYTYNGSSIVSYKNGNVFSGGTSATGTLGSVANNVVIGARNILGEYFNSSISNLHIYTKPLKSSEIMQNFYSISERYGLGVVRNGLVLNLDAGNYSSYNGSGSTWFDLSPSVYDGELINSPVFTPSVGGNLSFDGVDDYVDLGKNLDFASTQFSNGFSIEMWVNPIVSTENAALFSSAQGGSGTEWQLYVWYNTDQKFGTAQRYGGNQNDFQTVNTFAPNNWYHLMVTSNNSTCRIYVNGVEQNSNGTGQPNNQPPNREVRIASFRGYAFSNCDVAICRVYNRALNGSEITQNYNADKIRFEIGYTSALEILSYYPDAPNGLYMITPPGSSQVQPIYCDMSGGGWMLVSSNDARSTLIPGGTGRNNLNYVLDRSTVLGEPNPNSDYIIGSIINNLTFTQVRIVGFGYQSIDGTFSFPNNLGTHVTAQWTLTTTGNSRFTEKVARTNVTVGGNGTIAPLAAFFVLDAVRNDAGFDANVNQSTVGGAGLADSSGDPSLGCYLGHGITEGSYEGWYNTNETVFDTQGYTTWVR